MRSSAAFSWLTGSFGFISFFSEGTWSARGWRCPTGASGKHLLVRVHRRRCGWISRASRLRNRRRTVDKGQQGYRRDQLSHNGSPSWDPPTAIMVRGSSIAKLRQASHFVQLLQRAGRKGGCLARRCRAYGRPDRTKGLPTAHAKWIGRYDRRGVILQHGSVRSIRAMRALRWLDGASGAG
jgi:hypothetical protein